ncbi:MULTISPECIES: hypothetical protein [Arthrobacter]|uniref:Uncharacterized protein n=2 Tax=Arthrobacter TaxID=1663 RepID=A0ABU9KIC2_9MICC|nr:hypothetical protein [Arthrobacter sp. YJM1]MDP5226452.1 hypothetical protein [Arthrobacter sp. YJM1]
MIALDDWLASLPEFARSHEEGEIEELFEAAAHGELEDSGDETSPIKPIRTDPDVYELRRKALSKPLRFYHAEPEILPDGLLKLHRHIKSSGKDQQTQIDLAVDRYRTGESSRWNRS